MNILVIWGGCNDAEAIFRRRYIGSRFGNLDEMLGLQDRMLGRFQRRFFDFYYLLTISFHGH